MLTSIVVGILFLLFCLLCLTMQRDILHPAVVMPAVWGGILIVIGIAAPFGYLQIGVESFLIFTAGVLMFSVGATFATIGMKGEKIFNPTYQIDFKKLASFCLLVHTIILPICLLEVSRWGAGVGDIFSLAYRLRADAVNGQQTVGPVVANYLAVGLFFIPVLLVGWMEKKLNFGVFAAISSPWLLSNLIINGRSGLVLLIFTLFYIYKAKAKRLPIKTAIIFFLIFGLIMVAGNLLVSKINAKISDGFVPVLQESLKAFFNYLLQGPILFSRYIENPKIITPTWDALIFPCYILQKINLCALPPLQQEYVNFTRNGDLGNVYSVFLSIYPKYNWLGVCLIFFSYGAWAAFHHVRRNQSIWHLLMGAFLFSAILLSIFNDSFGPNIYFFLKIALLSILTSYVFKKR